jgi:hypothetical protein
VEDTYLRFDKDLASFLQYLDKTIGKGQYLIFLTADHAVAHNPFFLLDHQLPAGSVNMSTVRRQISDSLEKRFGNRNIIENVVSSQVFLNDSLIVQLGLDRKEIKSYITYFLMKQAAVLSVVDLSDAGNAMLPQKLKTMIVNGFNQKLSGDLQVIVKPEWFESLRTGASHAYWNPYDAHIPLVWYGWKIKAGKSNRERYMTDIAPTLAALLHIQMPNSSIGDVIEELIR